MKVRVIGFAAVVGMVLSSQAIAQNVAITPEGRTTIHEYLIKEKIEPHIFKEHVVVETTLPEDV